MGEGFFFGRGSELTPPLARFPTLSSLRKRGENMECKESIRYTRFALSDSGSAGKAGKIHPRVEGSLGLPVMIFFYAGIGVAPPSLSLTSSPPLA